MIKNNVLRLLLLLVVMISFSSCEEDHFNRDWDEATNALCRYNWIDEYISTQGYSCTQELEFYPNGTGVDYTTTFYPNYQDVRKQDFRWGWDLEQGYFTSFYVEYYNGTDYYDNVHITNGWLKALLNGDPVTFEAIY